MSYVNAGYAAALSVLFVYSVLLVVRRRRLERAAAVRAEDAPGRAARDPDATVEVPR
jgi:hypothetical protein